jgi:hypothetical protein
MPKHRLGLGRPMSALGHKRTFAPQKAMSALPPKADIIPMPFRMHPSDGVARAIPSMRPHTTLLQWSRLAARPVE